MIVKAQGKSYAELLKTIKENIGTEENDFSIQKAKKTSTGDLLLEVKGKENAEKLKDTIKSTTNNEAIIKTNETVIHITGIDADIELDELKQKIRKHSGDAEAEVNVLSLKPTISGNSAATVKLKKEIAEELVKKGRIKSGWNTWVIKKRIHILRCFKCLSFGHRSKECTGQDRTDICLRCNKQGHRAKDCSNEPCCTTCKANGHRADQNRCPEFRKLIKDKMKETSSRRKPQKDNVHNEIPTN